MAVQNDRHLSEPLALIKDLANERNDIGQKLSNSATVLFKISHWGTKPASTRLPHNQSHPAAQPSRPATNSLPKSVTRNWNRGSHVLD